MAGGTLYTSRDNFRAYKALISAKYSGFDLRVVSDPPDFVLGETNKSPEFLAKFPLGKVPAFESKDGTTLFKSNAIAFYVASDALRGASITDAAYVQQWMEFAENEILPAACTWIFPCLGLMQCNKQNTERAKEDIKLVLGVLNQHLLTRTYLVGERISLADIAVASNLLQLYQLVLEPEFRKPFANVNRWFTTLVNQPQFKTVLGSVALCDKMAQFDAKKFEEIQGASKAGGKKEKQEKAPKKDKPAQQEKQPTADKPKESAKPAAAAEPEDEEEDEFAEKPSKDPFGHLPKGTLNMDDFKKVYSNNDTKTVALPYFWKNFDKENYSLWYSEYKFPEELKLVFMSCNLVTGMFQRLDRMRKHSFGSVIVFGEDNKSTISGVWFWRGHDLAFTLSDDLQIDFESYKWRKLDPDSGETKKLVEEYFAWEGDFDGKKLNQGKIFK